MRAEYYDNTGPQYLRFVDVLTGEPTPAFGADHALGCALVPSGSLTYIMASRRAASKAAHAEAKRKK